MVLDCHTVSTTHAKMSLKVVKPLSFFLQVDARVSLNTPFQQRIHSGHTVGVSETPTTHETMNWGGIGEEVNEGNRVEMRNASMLRLNDSIFEMPVVFPQQPSLPLDTYASSSAVIPPAAEGLHKGDEGDLDSEVDLREMFESTTTSPSLNIFIMINLLIVGVNG